MIQDERELFTAVATMMPKTYSDDLRCKLLEAYSEGQGGLRDHGNGPPPEVR